MRRNPEDHSRSAVILHTVEDAKNFLGKKIEGYLLLSTNPSVDTFLKYESDLTSSCLSNYLTYDQIKADIDSCIVRTDEIIHKLDASYSGRMAEIQYLKDLEVFNILYSFVIKYTYAPYWTILQAIRNAIVKHDVNELYIYDLKGFSLLGCQTSFVDLMRSLDYDIQVHVIGESRVKITSTLEKAMRAPWKAISAVLDKFKGNQLRAFDELKPTVLIFESMYDLAFIKDGLKDTNVIHYQKDSLYPSNQFPEINKCASKGKFDNLLLKAVRTLDDLVINEVIDNFNRNIHSYIESLEYLGQVNKKYPVQFVLSGNAATFGIKALIYAYLRNNNIPVAIGQHGFNYGIQDPYGMHVYSDYDRCDYFFSYGFQNDHLKKLYKNREGGIECEVCPVGSTRLRPIQSKPTKKIDILYPLMNTVSMLQQGLFLGKPDEQTKIQEKLLLYLESKKGLNIIVKPFINYNDYNCSVMPVLKRLKNIKVMDDINFIESFKKYDVGAVLIDYISTALSEAMPYDVEIFAVGNPMDGIDDDALALLRKRVYYSDRVDEIISLIDKKLSNELEPRRDSSFMDEFIFRENTEQNVKDFIMSKRSSPCAES
jgi:hypothetical protein